MPAEAKPGPGPGAGAGPAPADAGLAVAAGVNLGGDEEGSDGRVEDVWEASPGGNRPGSLGRGSVSGANSAVSGTLGGACGGDGVVDDDEDEADEDEDLVVVANENENGGAGAVAFGPGASAWSACARLMLP